MDGVLGEKHLLETGNGRMCFYVRGERSDLPDLVLEHGNGGNSIHWARLAPLLAAHGRVFSYDRAGSGGSPPDSLGYGAAAATQRLSHLVQQAGVRKPFVLAGYSLGGLYARHYAASHPQDVLSLVLVDPTPTEWETRPDQVRRTRRVLWTLHWAARFGLLPAWWKVTGKKVSPDFRRDMKELASPGALSRLIEQMEASTTVRTEITQLAPQLSHPALALIAGSRPGMPESDATRLRDMNRELIAKAPTGSRLVEIAEADHGSILKDVPAVEQCADKILYFVRHPEAFVRA